MHNRTHSLPILGVSHHSAEAARAVFQTHNRLHHRARNVITLCHMALPTCSEILKSKDISCPPAQGVVEEVNFCSAKQDKSLKMGPMFFFESL